MNNWKKNDEFNCVLWWSINMAESWFMLLWICFRLDNVFQLFSEIRDVLTHLLVCLCVCSELTVFFHLIRRKSSEICVESRSKHICYGIFTFRSSHLHFATYETLVHYLSIKFLSPPQHRTISKVYLSIQWVDCFFPTLKMQVGNPKNNNNTHKTDKKFHLRMKWKSK